MSQTARVWAGLRHPTTFFERCAACLVLAALCSLCADFVLVGLWKLPGALTQADGHPIGLFLVIPLLMLFASVGSSIFFLLLLIHDISGMSQIHTSPGLEESLDVGDAVIYRKQKVSMHPGPRAYGVCPTVQGDNYSYFVDKFWTVENVLHDGRILVTTRTNKHHYLSPDDPNLRKAGILVRLRHRNRFPRLEEAA